MPVSGVGVILSGGPPFQIRGTVPNLIPSFYKNSTTYYQLPSGPNLAGTYSSKDESSSAKIIENQLVGITRTHTVVNGITFDGSYVDGSNYNTGQCLVTISGIEAFINNIYVGGRPEVLGWSGLSTTGTNYLWISLVEQNSSNQGYLSSRQFRHFECRSTTNGSQPIGPESSVLVATYVSGTGININPVQKNKVPLLLSHLNNNHNPHGDPLLQDKILSSGVNVLGKYNWNYIVASGAPSGIPFNNVQYLNQLIINSNTTIICSGILGNILSGDLTNSLFSGSTFKNLYVDPGIIGNLVITSGSATIVNSGISTISGSIFRNQIYLGSGTGLSLISGVTVQPEKFFPLESNIVYSGTPLLHYHSLNSQSGLSIGISPKYPGAVYSPPYQTSFGKGTAFPFEHNFDLGPFQPTLRCKSQTPTSIFIRQLMPTNYNKLESISINYAIDSGSTPVSVKVRDSLGVLQTPYAGNILTSSGSIICNISGIPQSGFGQNLPVDLEISVPGVSGTNQYFGNIVFNFRSQKS